MTVGIDLTGKIAVITGSKGDIGAAIMRRLTEAGATCVGLDMAMPAEGESNYFGVNVASEESVLGAFEQIVHAYYGIDILVNSAGILRDAYLLKMTLDQFKQVVDVNQTGTFLCMREAGRFMRAQGVERGGCIVNISSIAAAGNAGQVNYSGTKGAVESMTSTAAKELARYGVRVNAVAPGPVESKMFEGVPDAMQELMVSMTPLQKAAVPMDVANGILFLVSDLASHITGETITISGGLHIP